MSRSALMDDGSLSPLMAAAGFQSVWNRIGGLTAMAIGSARKGVGIGPAMSLGLGPLTIMDVGIGGRNLAGFGCLRCNGRQPGFPGTRAMAASDGRRCIPRPGLPPAV